MVSLVVVNVNQKSNKLFCNIYKIISMYNYIMSLSLNYNYLNHLRNIVNENAQNHSWEPQMLYNQKRERGQPLPGQYAQDAHMVGKGLKSKAKRFVNKHGSEILDYAVPVASGVLGAYVGGPVGASTGYTLGNVGREIIRDATGYGRPYLTQPVVEEPVKKVDKKKSIIKKVASTALDYVPSIASMGTQAVTGNKNYALAAHVGTKLAREGLRGATGLGKQKRGRGKVSNFVKAAIPHVLDVVVPYAFTGEDDSYRRDDDYRPSGDNVGQRVLGVAAREGIRKLTGYAKPKKQKKQLKPNDKRVIRGQQLKRLMKEHNISFIEASKMLAQNK
jgi:hypothetical protein